MSVLVVACVGTRFFSVFARSVTETMLSRYTVKRVICNDPEFNLSYLEGKNIFTLCPAKEAALISRDPGIGRVNIRKAFPDTLRVLVSRPLPFARVQFNEGDLVAVAPSGEIVSRETISQPLPRITGVSPDNVPAVVPAVAELIKALEEVLEIESVRVSSDFFTLQTPAGESVYLPRKGFADRVETLSRILADFQQKRIRYRYIDLRFTDPVFLPDSSGRLPGR